MFHNFCAGHRRGHGFIFGAVIVCGREFSPELIARLNERGGALSRRALSRQLCQWLDWKGPSGGWQTTNARISLKRLQSKGLLDLPKPAKSVGRKPKSSGSKARALNLPPIRASLAEIGPVELVLVGSRRSETFRQCRELLEA